MKKIVFIYILLLISVSLVGCFRKKTESQNKPTSSIPPVNMKFENDMLEDLDENDYLDEALNELEAVE